MNWIVQLSSGERWRFSTYAEAYFFATINFGFMGYWIYQKN